MIAEKRTGVEKWYLGNGLSKNPSHQEVLQYSRQKLGLKEVHVTN
jgi:hypothetical protein